MELEKELFLEDLKIQRVSNAPCVFTGILGGEKSSLTVTREAAEYLLGEISPFDIPGKDLPIVLSSEEIVVPEGKFSVLNIPDKERLTIKGVYEVRNREWQYLTCPPSQREEVNYSLHLQTPHMNGMHFSSIPCPYLDLKLPLTEAEYREASELSSNVVFRWDLKQIK